MDVIFYFLDNKQYPLSTGAEDYANYTSAEK